MKRISPGVGLGYRIGSESGILRTRHMLVRGSARRPRTRRCAVHRQELTDLARSRILTGTEEAMQFRYRAFGS